MQYDIAVIGGGPGGYTAAAEAAQAGYRVVLFERDELGGVCLNRGCMPTKALLHASETYAALSHAQALGISAESVSWDFAAMHRYKNDVVGKLRRDVEQLMRTRRVTVVRGSAQVTGEGQIVCGGETYSATDIILAVGSQPSLPPIEGVDQAGVYTSNDLLEGEGLPFHSLVIIGGGVIGVECASIYLPLRCQVMILEAAERILPPLDREIAQRLTMTLKRQGASITTKALVRSISGQPGSMIVAYREQNTGKECLQIAEAVLVATGRRPALEGLFAEGYAPVLERGAIAADAQGRTSLPHLYVIGDARAGSIQLAHAACAQAKNVVAVIAGKTPPVDESIVPSCVYSTPEAASVGLTEQQAKAAGYAVRCGKYLTGANGKCVIEGAPNGYLKLVAERTSGTLLGAQLVCPRATDLIGELALAVQRKLTAAELAAVIHPHPTFCEMISGAAEALR